MGDANISDFKIKTHIEKQQKLFMTPHNRKRKETKKKTPISIHTVTSRYEAIVGMQHTFDM
jgi:hypothetical protein